MSRSTLGMFDTPMSSMAGSRVSLDLDLSDLGTDAELERFAGYGTSPAPRPPSPFQSSATRPRTIAESEDDTTLTGRGWKSRLSNVSVLSGRNLIELEDGSSTSTADLKAHLSKTRTQFERSLTAAKESSPVQTVHLSSCAALIPAIHRLARYWPRRLLSCCPPSSPRRSSLPQAPTAPPRSTRTRPSFRPTWSSPTKRPARMPARSGSRGDARSKTRSVSWKTRLAPWPWICPPR